MVRPRMRFSLQSTHVLVDGVELPGVMNAAEMEALAGATLSTRAITMHPSGFRHATVADKGIVWYLDKPEGRASHFYLAIVPTDTPEKPSVSYCGSVDLDGWELTQNCTEASLRTRCPWQLQGHIHSWSYRTPCHCVSFIFERHRNRMGRRAEAHKLSHVSISFKNKNGEQARCSEPGDGAVVDNRGSVAPGR